MDSGWKTTGYVNGNRLDKAEGYNCAAREHLIGGGAVAELEKKIAGHYQAKHALCTSSATAGLLALALALDLRDSAFITSPFTFGGSLASWLLLGNRPVFTDIDASTLTLDPQLLEKVISSETKAILSVDIFGNPSDTGGLSEIAKQNGLWYIADAAQSFGAARDGRPASYLADASVISFTTGKTLSCGEGGAVVTSNTDLYERLLWFSQHPLRQRRELGLSTVNEFAYNARINPVGAALANSVFETSLKKLARYQERCVNTISILNDSGLIEPIYFERDDIRPSFFCLSVEPKDGITGTAVIDYLREHGVSVGLSSLPASIVYKNPAFTEPFEGRFSLPLPCIIAERAERRIALILENDSPDDEEEAAL